MSGVSPAAASPPFATTREQHQPTLGTVYQNTTARPMLVVVYCVSGGGSPIVRADVGATSSPATAVALQNSGTTVAPIVFVVPSQWYYSVVQQSAVVVVYDGYRFT